MLIASPSSGLDPAVTAAWIAAAVSLATLLGSMAMQALGIRRVSRDTTGNVRKQLDLQREQLERTLAEERRRTLNERFGTAADRLGTDRPAPVRLAAVYAMAGLADEWPENRQTCVDVLCGYLRMPYSPDPGDDAAEAQRLTFQAGREVRHTVIRLIGDHLREGADQPWRDLNLDFTGVRFDGGDFWGAVFSGERVSFAGAVFSAGRVNFRGAVFSGFDVSFRGAVFSGGEVWFPRAQYSGGSVCFDGAQFCGGRVFFAGGEFSGAQVSFRGVQFSDGYVDFGGATFSDNMVWFNGAKFTGGEVDFSRATFSGGSVWFSAWFSGSEVSFSDVEFSGGLVDFSRVGAWSHPPVFDFDASSPPEGVLLPPEATVDLVAD